MPGRFIVAGDSFARPSDTTQYASGDLVANSTTAASVVPLTFTVSQIKATGFLIRRARIKKTNTSTTSASFRLHLYKQSPVPSNGDNAAWLTAEKLHLGSMDVAMDKVFTDAAKGIAVSNEGTDIIGLPDDNTLTIYGLLEARATYTPASGETLSVTLEILQD